MKSNDALSTPEAIRALFSIELSKHKGFKDLVYPLVRYKKFLKVHKVPIGESSSREQLLIDKCSLNKLYNAVLLQGFFADSKRVRDIFSNNVKRKEAADFLETVVCGRQSVIGISLQSEALIEFISNLKSDFSLSDDKMPNPFEQLPQLSLNGKTSLIQVLLVQSAVLSDGDTMMLNFLDGDLKKAYDAACKLESDDQTLIKYKAIIVQKYQEAKEFDKLLDDLLN